jgi:endonuclease IV
MDGSCTRNVKFIYHSLFISYFINLIAPEDGQTQEAVNFIIDRILGKSITMVIIAYYGY